MEQEVLRLIPLDQICVEKNIRKIKDDDKSIEELAQSLKNVGQLQPIGVYQQEANKYVIIYGHRRYFAAKIIGMAELNCLIRERPDDVERIYIQAIENEQSKSLSASEREEYFTSLLNAGQSSTDICKKMGISPSLLSQAIKAREGRAQFGEKFDTVGIELDTYSAYQIAGATEESVDSAIQAILTNPGMKKTLIKGVAQLKLKTTAKGRKRKYSKNVSGSNEGGLSTPFNRLCRTLRIKHGDTSIEDLAKELNEKGYTGYTSGQLLQHENQAKGPPLELVQAYAKFFQLDDKGKFDLYYAALTSSQEITIDISQYNPPEKNQCLKFVAAILASDFTLIDKIFSLSYPPSNVLLRILEKALIDKNT